MKTQMLRIYEEYKDDERIVPLSHSIGPEHDTVEVLRDYGARLDIEADRWHLVTGNKELIYKTTKLYGLAAI